MTHPLVQLRDLLYTHADPGKQLELADKYLKSMEEMGADFTLPRIHRELEPILNFYHGDLIGWEKFVKSVRDMFPPRDPRFDKISGFHRTLEGRLAQRERRERRGRAVARALELKLIADDPKAKIAYADKCERIWSKRRDEARKIARASFSRKSLRLEEQEEILGAFWADIDREIDEGILPPP